MNTGSDNVSVIDTPKDSVTATVPDEIASSLRRAGCSASEVAKFMKEFIPNMTGEFMVVVLKLTFRRCT